MDVMSTILIMNREIINKVEDLKTCFVNRLLLTAVDGQFKGVVIQ